MSLDPNHLVAEERQSLWLLVISPAVWMAHFVLSYIAAAVWCGKLAGRYAGLGPVQLMIVGLAVVALIAIAITGRAGWRKHIHGESEPPHDKDTPEDRHRFLGFATVLLSGLSAIATVYVTLSSLFLRSCL